MKRGANTGVVHRRIGSGCHIGKGYILSCGHILRHEWKPKIITTTGEEYEAEVLAVDGLKDLSMLYVKEEHNIPSVEVTSGKNPYPKTFAQLSGIGKLGYRRWEGEVKGYQGRDILVKGHGTNDGDSGGPIVINNKVASVINEYDPARWETMGPCPEETAKFVKKVIEWHQTE